MTHRCCRCGSDNCCCVEESKPTGSSTFPKVFDLLWDVKTKKDLDKEIERLIKARNNAQERLMRIKDACGEHGIQLSRSVVDRILRSR